VFACCLHFWKDTRYTRPHSSVWLAFSHGWLRVYLDRFELRKLLDTAEPLNLFQRSSSGNLTRFQPPRSMSTEPYMEGRERGEGGERGVQIYDREASWRARESSRNRNDSSLQSPYSFRKSESPGRSQQSGGASPVERSSPAGARRSDVVKRDQELMDRLTKQVATCNQPGCDACTHLFIGMGVQMCVNAYVYTCRFICIGCYVLLNRYVGHLLSLF
jgi:hypothetical protein